MSALSNAWMFLNVDVNKRDVTVVESDHVLNFKE